jgi:hypothetical protein
MAGVDFLDPKTDQEQKALTKELTKTLETGAGLLSGGFFQPFLNLRPASFYI